MSPVRVVPLVTAAAGCGGTGPELARFGDLGSLDAVLIGPIGPGTRGPRATVCPSPSGLVHTPATVIPVARVVGELLPWCAARGLPVILAVRGGTTGSVVGTLSQLRRSLDFGTVRGVEIDLATQREGTRSSLGGLAGSDPDAPWSTDPQGTLKLLSAAREQLPRDLLLMAKFGGECPDPVGTARAAVGGGARALVLSGSVPAAAPAPLLGGAPTSLLGNAETTQLGTAETTLLGDGQDPGLEGGPDHWLAGPAIAPITLGLVTRVRAAMTAARIPPVPIVAVGGVHTPEAALEVRRAGADGVQVGSGILTDPELLWRVHDALAQQRPAAPSAVPTPEVSHEH